MCNSGNSDIREAKIEKLRKIINEMESLDKEDFIFDELMVHLTTDDIEDMIEKFSVTATIINFDGTWGGDVKLVSWSIPGIKDSFDGQRDVKVSMYNHDGLQWAVVRHTYPTNGMVTLIRKM